MARLDDISDEARRAIAAGAAPLIARHEPVGLGAPAQPMILGPTLREEMLTLDAVRSGAAAPQPTGQTLSLLQAPAGHQTLGAGPGASPAPAGYVRAEASAPGLGGGPGDAPSVTAVSASDLSARIQSALDWIDAEVPGDPLVRVLTAPAYHLTALVLYRGDEAQGVVALPSETDGRFEPRRVYPFDEFLSRLQGLPPAEGLALP